VEGAVPEAFLHRITHPRGGQVRAIAYDLAAATEEAMWDLAAKRADLPLYRYLGGTSPIMTAYISGLCFHMPDQEAHEFYSAGRAAGYRAAKIKVGHQDPAWDLARVRLISEAMGPDATLMIDANEAWTAKQAARRLAMFAEAGIDLHWVEDPLPRHDFAGLKFLRGTTSALVNSGEYLEPEDRAQLVAAGAADIINMNGSIGANLRLARTCVAANQAMTLGNSMMNGLVHLAAALPDMDMAEDSQLDWNDLVAEQIPVIDGSFRLPDRPGHGLAIADDADTRCNGS